MNCAKCNKDKFKKDFGPDKTTETGRCVWCLACKKEYQKLYAKALKATSGPSKGSRKATCAYYGISEDDFREILELQGDGCAGCGREPREGKNLSIDHGHLPGEKKRSPWERVSLVRGILCYGCNRLLGIARDNAKTLYRLAVYLEDPPAIGVLDKRAKAIKDYLDTKGELP